ncbi:conjugal transfer protein TraF [Martelella alba]|uniref:Conjugal transfer protein TraF n=1 Tax=Martelella alba TaxID=2590451 RepID=A0A506U0H8_9HYPH|nr:type IV secretion system protein [Martelella alba]TPW27066.1 conjugal transfer protein TraF [Martelella alba]
MKRTSFILSLAVTGFLASQSHAQSLPSGIPTSDEASLAQTYAQWLVMEADADIQKGILEQAKTQIKRLEAQLTQLKEIYGQFSGARDIVGMAMDDLKLEDAGPRLDGVLKSSLGDVLGTINAGKTGNWSGFADGKSSVMRKGVTQALSAAGLSQENVSALAQSADPGAQRAASQASAGAVLAASAEQTYSETGQSLQRVEKIVNMSKSSTDIKESIDLNTRMLAELSVQLAKSLELQSIEAVYNGQAGVLSAAAIAEERKYMTFSTE